MREHKKETQINECWYPRNANLKLPRTHFLVTAAGEDCHSLTLHGPHDSAARGRHAHWTDRSAREKLFATHQRHPTPNRWSDQEHRNKDLLFTLNVLVLPTRKVYFWISGRKLPMISFMTHLFVNWCFI